MNEPGILQTWHVIFAYAAWLTTDGLGLHEETPNRKQEDDSVEYPGKLCTNLQPGVKDCHQGIHARAHGSKQGPVEVVK